jgi:hypothetical protein
MSSIQYNLTPSSFTDSRPLFAGQNSTVPSNLRFANDKICIKLEDTTYKVIQIEIIGNGDDGGNDYDVDYLSVGFSQPNGSVVGVSMGNPNSLYAPSSTYLGMPEFIIIPNGYSNYRNFYVVVNSNSFNLSDTLELYIAAGKKISSTANYTIYINFKCDGLPVYKYTTGIHTYSPYDAKADIAVHNTKLYSLTPISAWTTNNTVIWCTPLLTSPALPYFYGYQNKVYQIGLEIDRGYGTLTSWHYYKPRWKQPKKGKLTQITQGPTSWVSEINNQRSSVSCITPSAYKLSNLSKIYLNSELAKPEKYFYYMGYDNTNPQKSNDDYFNWWNFANQSLNPINGSTHALTYLADGFKNGTPQLVGVLTQTQFYVALIGAVLALILGIIGLGSGGSDEESLANIGNGYPNLTEWLGINPIGDSYCVGGIRGLGPIGPISSVLLIIAAIIIIIEIYKPITKDYYPNCNSFYHVFTNTAYISGNTNTSLYLDKNMTVSPSGTFCDGQFFYTQTNNKVINKEISHCCEVLVNNSGSGTYTLCSNTINATERGKLVTGWNELIILPYQSGKNIPFCGIGNPIYYNDDTCGSVQPSQCCRYETCPPITVCISAGTIASCSSKAEANSIANTKLQILLDWVRQHAVGQGVGRLSQEQLNILPAYFTHEIEVQSNSTKVAAVYDNRVNNGVPQIGTKLFYDDCGCTPVMNGYYSISATTFTNYYRTFYHTTNGAIDNILYMANENSTTTTTGQTIKRDKYDYNSDWYLFDINNYQLTNAVNQLTYDNRSFDPNTLYTGFSKTVSGVTGITYNYKLVKGFKKDNTSSASTTPLEFYVYDNFTTTGYSEATSGNYQPMSTFIFSEEQFYWKKSNELLINVVEVCGTQSQPRGVNINFRSCPENNQTCELTPNNDIVSMKITAYTANNSYKYSFDTLQGLSQTFISFEGRIPYNDTITSIKVGEVVSNLPVYNQTYVVNEPVLCSMVNCLTTLNIEGIYLGSTDDLELMPGNYIDPCVNDGEVITRTTNNAVFEIYLNSIYVGDLLLNNGGGTGTNALTPGGKYICYDYRNLPNSLSFNNSWPGTTSSRYSKISINKSKAEEILQQKNGMNVNFYFYPAVTTVDKVPGCYGDIPNYESNWVRITKNTTTVLYNQCLTSSNINNIPINVCGT